MIPFSEETYFTLFADTNLTHWRAIIGAYVLLVVIVVCARIGFKGSDRIVLLVVSAASAWTAWLYFGQILSSVLWASWIFAGAFYLQAAIALGLAFAPSPPVFRLVADNRSWTGAAALAFAAIFFPLLAAQVGHAWPQAQLPGIAPAVTASLTLCVLVLTRSKIGFILLPIPLIYMIITLYLAIGLGIWEDLLLIGVTLAALGVAASETRPGHTQTV